MGLAVGGSVSTAWAQSSERRADDSGALTDEFAMPMAGFWPTERMVRLLSKRAAIGIGREYDLDDEQIEALHEQMVNRWPQFLPGEETILITMGTEQGPRVRAVDASKATPVNPPGCP